MTLQNEQQVSVEENVRGSGLTKTKYGVPIDYSFSTPASEERIKITAEALAKNGFEVHVVESRAEARSLMEKLLPIDKIILTGASETLKSTGIDQLIDGPESKYKSLRQELVKMDPATQFRQMVKMGATPDVIVGSVHAVTEQGQVLVASGSGSQLGPYSAGAEKVFWVVGTQKLVKDLETGLRRLKEYSFPLEDIRMHELRNHGSALSKILIVNLEAPGRTTIVLVKESLGF